MKKILLSLGAAMLAGGAFAAENVIATMYPGNATLIGWGCEGLMEQPVTVDGRECVKIAQTAEGKQSWEVQFAFDAEGGYEIGTTYYFTFDVKGTPSDGIPSGFQCTDGYIGCGNMNNFAITEDWNTVTISGTVTDPGDGKSVQRWVASIGNYIGTFYISNMKLYTVEEGGEEPNEAIVLAETDFTTATSYNFWKSDATNAEIKDGALVITNEAATANFWDVQYMVADNFQLTGGVDYTVAVKIKGFSGNLHYNFGTWGANVNGGATVEEASDWQTVTFVATAKEDTDGTAHLLLQSGDFVGTYSIASVKITYPDTGSVESVATNAVRTGVYTINGMRVADRDNLLPGLYIIDGKKVLVK